MTYYLLTAGAARRAPSSVIGSSRLRKPGVTRQASHLGEQPQQGERPLRNARSCAKCPLFLVPKLLLNPSDRFVARSAPRASGLARASGEEWTRPSCGIRERTIAIRRRSRAFTQRTARRSSTTEVPPSTRPMQELVVSTSGSQWPAYTSSSQCSSLRPTRTSSRLIGFPMRRHMHSTPRLRHGCGKRGQSSKRRRSG